MIVAPTYTRAELQEQYSSDVLLISGTYGSAVEEVVMHFSNSRLLRRGDDLLSSVLAILGVAYVPGIHGLELICDLYVHQHGKTVVPGTHEKLSQLVQEGRTVRWQDELTYLLSEGRVSRAAVEKTLTPGQDVGDLFAPLADV